MRFTSAENRQVIERYLAAVSGQAKTPEVVAQFVDDPGLAAHIGDVESAFPRYEILAEELIAERDLVAMRGLFRGVHQGPFAGVPPTGRAVSAGLMVIYRLEGGRIVEHWLQFDAASLMAQLSESSLTHA